MKYLTLFSVLALLSTSVSATESRGDARERIEPKGYLYGIGLSVNQEIYKGYDYRAIPLPILGYRGDNFRALGPFVSYDAVQFSAFELTLQAAPRFQGFNDSDSYIFKNMSERKFSMDAGLGLSYERKDWKIKITSMFDILNRSNGFEAKANISRVFRKGPLFFEPSLRISYLDSHHVNYYYGVKENEINEFTYQYQADSTINTTLSFSVATPIFFGGFTRMSIDYTQFGSAITNSPLVDKSNSLSTRLIFSKFF